MNAQPSFANTFSASYTETAIRESDGTVSREPVRWEAEGWFDARLQQWFIEVTRNGQTWETDVDPDELERVLEPGCKDRATARRIARKIRGY